VRSEEKHARFQQVLEWRRQSLTFQEIGERLGLGRQRVQQIHAAALRWEATLGERLTSASPAEALRIVRPATVGLRRRGITTVGQVATMSDAELLTVRYVGPDAVAAIRADLAARYHEDG